MGTREESVRPKAGNDDTSCVPPPTGGVLTEPADGRGKRLPMCSETLWLSHSHNREQKGDGPSEIKPERIYEIKPSELNMETPKPLGVEHESLYVHT